jgi:hypothetical protein
MKAARSGIVIGLALALVVPMTAAAQDSLEGTAVAPDPTGDLRSQSTKEPRDGPGYLDIERMTVEVADGVLRVTFDTMGDIPAEPESMVAPANYHLIVDAGGDGSDSRRVDIRSEGGWHGDVTEFSNGDMTQVTTLALVDDMVIVTIPYVVVGNPQDIRFRGLAQSIHTPEPEFADDLNGWEDWVPSEHAWLTLGGEVVDMSPAPTEAPSSATSVDSTAVKDRILGQMLHYDVERAVGVQGVTMGYLRKQVDRFLRQHADEFADYRDPLEGQSLDRAAFKWLFGTLKKGAPYAAKDGKAAKENSKLEVLGNYIYRLLLAYEYAVTDEARDAAATLADTLFDYGVTQVRLGSPALRAERIGLSANDLYDRAKA